MKICLVLIVKNEAKVLPRCLMSAVDYIDSCYILDTGSTKEQWKRMRDYTQALGQTHKVPISWDQTDFVDFATCRTWALRGAEKTFPEASHLLMIDADDYITKFAEPEFIGALGYHVTVRSQNIAYPRVQLFAAGEGWRYRGVLHEYPTIDGNEDKELSTAPIVVVSTREGARSQDPNKYAKDAEILHKAIRNCPIMDADLLPRYRFYLAQSYENAGNFGMAKECYKKRIANHSGYSEERYVSLLRLARIEYASLAGNEGLILDYCKQAQIICPQRREAAHVAVCVLNGAQRYNEALAIWYDFPLFPTPTGLFIEPEIYRWQYREQCAIAAFYAGEHKKALRMFYTALKAQTDLSVDAERLVRNMGFAIEKL